MRKISLIAPVFYLLVVFAFVSTVSAAHCRVTTAEDRVDQSCDLADCSLREAIVEPSCSTIDFSLDVAGTPIVLSLGEFVIQRNLTITGWGADAITISGNHTSRIFYVSSGATLNLKGMTLRDGNGMGTLPADGGAIRSIGPVNLDSVYLTGNQAPGKGAAISYQGGASSSKTIRNSTFAENWGASDGRAAVYVSGTVNVYNSSLYNNGASIYVESSFLIMVNTTIGPGLSIQAIGMAQILYSNSVAPNLYRQGTMVNFHSNGNNIASTMPNGGSIAYAASDLVGADPALGPPQYYGGHMPILPLLPGSPAIDGGNDDRASAASLITDQRGFDRFGIGVSGRPIVDIGAFEFNAVAQPPVTVAGRVLGAVSGNPLRSQIVTITDMLGNTRTALSSSLGWFVFDDLPAGFVYRVSVKARRGTITRTVFGDQDLSDTDVTIPGW